MVMFKAFSHPGQCFFFRFLTTMYEWDAWESSKTDSESVPVPCEIWTTLHNVINNTLVPEKTECYDRPYEEKDFKKCLLQAEENLERIKHLLTRFSLLVNKYSECKAGLKQSTLVLLLIMCGEHMRPNVWSSKLTINLAHEILTLVCKFCNGETVGDILVKDLKEDEKNVSLFKPALLSLRPKLLKESWKGYPAAVACFCWIVSHVKSPHLSDHLGTVLPTALILVDDFVPENRVQGITCLHHIIENVPRTQLCWYGQSEVIYRALHPLLYQREPLVVAPLLACMTALLEKLEGGPEAEDRKLEWRRYDDVLQVLLDQMELEQLCAVRREYARALPPLLAALGPATARWSKRLLHVLQAYLETASYSDLTSTLFALQAVQVYQRVCVERVSSHAPQLAAALLHLLYDLSQPDMRKQEIMAVTTLAVECLRSVLEHAPEFARELCHELQTCKHFSSQFQEIVDSAFKYHRGELSQDVLFNSKEHMT